MPAACSLKPDHMFEPIIRYRMVKRLGAGGMGEVFLAEDRSLERRVAIKFVSRGLQEDAVAHARLEREAKAAAALDHPYICKIYELTEVDGKTGIVMEYVSGESLLDALVKRSLTTARILELAAEIAEALDEAHSHGIVHRDLKPSNFMLSAQGHVKVMDFGMVRRLFQTEGGGEDETLTAAGTVVGTVVYMAPEQLLGQEADARSDIFSFGVSLFELLTGEHPFRRARQADTIQAILYQPPVSLPPESRARADFALFDRLLAKAADDRYQTFTEVRAELRRLNEAAAEKTVASSGADAARTTAPVGRRTPYVGRETERAELEARLGEAIRGRGSLMLLGGEPGVGKTRLAEQILDAGSRHRCLPLTGRCYEIEGAGPFIPFVEVLEQAAERLPERELRDVLGDAAPEVARLLPDLRRRFPDISPPLEMPPEQQRRFLFKSVVDCFERAGRARSLVVLLDDLQWADESTLLLLQHLAPQLDKMPVLVLGTYRDVELDLQRPFAQVLETLTRQRLAKRINVRRLPEAGVHDILVALGGPAPPPALVASIYEETEGNPFFVEEVFHHLSEEGVPFADGDASAWRADFEVDDLQVPEGVRLVLARRLERVGEETQRVLTSAAVVGRSFSLPLLEALGDVTGDTLLTALEEAEAAHLIVAVPGREPRWEFSHALIRQTLVGTLSLPRRQQLHRRIAEGIEATTGDALETRTAELAHHLYQAGTAVDASKTVRVLQRAAAQVHGQGAFDEALTLLDNALPLVPETEQAGRAALLLARGGALQSLAQSERALADLEQAGKLFEALGDVEGTGQSCWAFAYLAAWRADNTRAISGARRGLAMVGEQPSATRSRLLGAAAMALGAAGEVDEAHRLIATAIAEAESLDDERLLGQLLNFNAVIGCASMAGREWAMVAERSAALLRDSDDLWQWVQAVAWRSLARWCVGDAELAEEAQQAEETAERVGDLGASAIIRMSRAVNALTRQGDLEAFERFARWFIDFSVRNDFPWKLTGASWLGLASFWRGRWDDARAHGARSLEFQQQMRHPRTAFGVWSNAVMVKAYTGEGDVGALLDEKASSLPRPGGRNSSGAWALLLKTVEARALLGQADTAASLYPLVLEALDTGTVTGFLTMELLQTGAGIAAAAGGQWDAAEEHYRTALRQAEELPHKIAQPEVRRWYARMLLDRDAAGDQDRARELLGEAVGMYEQLGMPRHVEMAKEHLKML